MYGRLSVRKFISVEEKLVMESEKSDGQKFT